MGIRHRLRTLKRTIRQRTLGEGNVNARNQGIVNLIDVGSVGDLPDPWYQHAATIHHLLKFEPRDYPDTNPFVTTVDAALWECEGKRDFYIYRGGSGVGSSLFEQNYDFVEANFRWLQRRGPSRLAKTWFQRSQLDHVERIPCRRLDNVLHELGHPFPYHFLKIDAQGAEYQILRGAEQFLARDCLGLHLELFVIPLYKGIQRLPAVVNYLDDMGFDFVQRFPPHGSFNSQHDCVFLKRNQRGPVFEAICRVYGIKAE